VVVARWRVVVLAGDNKISGAAAEGTYSSNKRYRQ